MQRRFWTTMAPQQQRKLTTIIFDVDDCLYDVTSGFTAHRNGEVVWQYMVDHLGFANHEEARALRDEYFQKYHSTAKALTEAQKEGKFPAGAPTFSTQHMSQYWADHLDYTKLGGAKPDVRAFLDTCPLRLVAFSNGPRTYVQRALESLGLREVFGDDRLFCVDDVLPHCKPEREAFEVVFRKLGIEHAEECIMVEDSMKNVRIAKSLGMKTVLVTGKEETGRILPEDRPEANDPAVDCSITTIEEFQSRLPGLWQDPPVFEPTATP